MLSGHRDFPTKSRTPIISRASSARGDLGLARRDKSLGRRRTADASVLVNKVWVLEHAPRDWDMQQVAQILGEHFNDVRMFRQLHRKGWKNFVFRGARKRGADADLAPLIAQLAEWLRATTLHPVGESGATEES